MTHLPKGTKSIILLSVFLCILNFAVFLINYCFYGGNHWIFYGTFFDIILVKYKFTSALILALPMIYPVLIHRTSATILIAIGSIVIFFYHLFLFTLTID